MQELLAQVRHLSSSVHDLSRQLHPSKLEQLGLVAAIGGLCHELARTHGLKIEFTHRQIPPVIPPDTAVCLYRIAQEGLGNAIKHSGAQRASVELSGTADAISLQIVDDGTGFDPRLIRGKGGLGLVSMRERVLHLGGEIAIDSQPAGGTRLRARVPLMEVAKTPT
jgi:signal transduction histidine kinase